VDRDASRAELGYDPDERICIATAGGSAAGERLLRRVIESHPAAAQRVPGLRTIVVAGPRIAADALPRVPGVEILGYVHDLSRQLAACDIAVVHGGLATIWSSSPRGGRSCTSLSSITSSSSATSAIASSAIGPDGAWTSTPHHSEVVADAIANEIDRAADYRPLEADGARRAATLIAELL
jgi:hypothetical protein